VAIANARLAAGGALLGRLSLDSLTEATMRDRIIPPIGKVDNAHRSGQWKLEAAIKEDEANG